MSATTLTSVFLQSEGALREELSNKYLPKDYAEIQKTVNKHIIDLLSGDNEFKNSLNASDAELLNAALRMALSFQQLSLSESIDFKALSTKTEYQVDQQADASSNNDIIENTLSLLPTVICAFINPWLTLAVGGGTVLVKKVVRGKNGTRREVLVKERKVDVSHKISSNEIDAIIDGINNICQEIDGIISKIQRDRKDLLAQMENKLDDCTLEKMYPQVLASLQYLFMENLKSDNKNQYVQNMLFNLQGYGYSVVEYSDATAGFFTKKANPNVSEITMYLPAITKDIHGTPSVVAEGIVYIPA
ncbi:hypothetical protein [Bacteroides acidifaciens]|uniref:hypothetical protein n=1 Tax=Bacteroides acidifaciens TaxID=85831 RepID=UPI00262BA94B|nr:hypothetical protein [Bacteroides acidifaciens]